MTSEQGAGRGEPPDPDIGWRSSAPAFLSNATRADAEPSAPHPFETVEAGRYEDVAVLGEGGMGRVRLVLDRRLKRQVALKEPIRGTDARRLSQEAWITAQLEHPGIVSVYDAGRTGDGDLYYTMRLVRGRSLEEVLAAAPGGAGLSKRLAYLRPFLAACEAVAFAHRAGIVHRDLKPQNIMLGEFGEAVVVDWGIARPLADDDAAWRRAALPTELGAETQLGEVVGTPAYMSPEQGLARPSPDAPVDARSDVWSLGATLYRLLVGEPPFGAGNTSEVLARLRDQPIPSIEARMPEVPRELVAIAQRALARDRAERYPDAKALAADIAAWLDGRRVSAHPYSTLELLTRLVKAWRVPLIVAAVALVLLAVLAVVTANRVVDERDRAVVAEAQTRDALAGSDANLARALLGQAEGARDEGQRPEAELFAVHALRLARPDSPEAAAARGILMGFAGPRPEVVATAELVDCPARAFDPTMTRMLCGGDSASLWQLGGRLERLWQRPLVVRSGVFVADAVVVLTPDRALISLLGGEERDRAKVAQLGRLVAANGHALVLYGWAVEAYAVTPDGALVKRGVFPMCAVHRAVEAATVTVNGDMVRLVGVCNDGTVAVRSLDPGIDDRLGLATPVVGRAIALSPDGRTLAILGEQGRLALIDVAGGPDPIVKVADTHLTTGLEVAWSPGGDALAIYGEGQGVRVFAVSADGIDPAYEQLPKRGVRGVVWASELWTVGDAAAHRWQLGTRAPVPVIGHVGDPGLATLAVSSDGHRVVVGRGNGALETWRDGVKQAELRYGDQVVKRVALAPTGDALYVSALDYDYIDVLAPETLAKRASFGDVMRYRRIDVLTDGSLLAASYVEPVARFTSDGTRRPIGASFIAADQDTDATGARVVFLEEGSGRVASLVAPFEVARELGRWPGAVAVAVDDAVAVLMEDQVVLVDLEGAERTRFATRGSQDVEIGHGLVVVAAEDRVTRLHSYTGELRAELGGHSERVAQVVFAQDALFTASWDGTVRRFGLGPLDAAPPKLVDQLEQTWGISLDLLLGR